MVGKLSLFCALVLTVVYGQIVEPDPCLRANHRYLDQPDRSTAVFLKRGDPGRNDEQLAKAWYVFTSGAGGEMPTAAPQAGACSSKKPIWINGTQPPMDGQIHMLNLCYFLTDFDTCGIQLQIRAKRCLHNTVYELVPTSSANSTQVITDGSYCAGSEKLCPPGQSSLTGFTPNCYVAPTVGDKPVIDVVELPDTFEFNCHLTNPRPQAAYKIEWRIETDFLKEEELQIGQTMSTLTQQDLVGARMDILGRNLTCSARGRYLADVVPKWGAAKFSDPYFVGIEVTDASGVPLHLMSNTLTLPESEEHQLFSVRSTVPLRCDPYYLASGAECKIEIAIRNDNSMEQNPLRCRNGVIEQLKLAKCGVTITPDNWWMPQPVAIKATKDFKYDGNRARIIEFAMTDGPGRSIWDGYVPQKIQVITEDFIDKRAQCASVNDPHMTTFDGHRWHNYFEGEFILYRHKELPFEVRAFYKRCGGATCNCAVAARAGDDVIIVDRCNSMGDIKIWGSDKKVEYNLLRTRTISTDDIIAPNFKIYALNGGREYRIYFPHGAMVRAQLTGGGHAQFMNLWMNPSPADFNRTEGMCGNFNGDKTEDLRLRNGTIFRGAGSANNQHPKEFSKHWRVLPGESIYNGKVESTATTYQKEYCSCVKGASTSFNYLDCQLNSDSARCDQTGEDITSKNFEYQAVNTKRQPPAFEFDPDWTPPVLDWPTPSGWTKANATQFCEDFIMKSEAFKQCNMTIDDDVDMCVEDIKMSDGIEFALTALESLKERCFSEWNKDPNANIPDDAFCYNECSNHGDCRGGVCLCDAGFVGEDCSLSKSQIPNVFFAPFCDVAEEKCGEAEIYGDGFIKSDDLTCSYQPAEIVDGSLVMKGSRKQAKASYENFAEVRCHVSTGRTKRSTNGGSTQPLAGQFGVSVANQPGAKASNVVIYTMYDSRCQTCNFKTGECKVKENKCMIEGHCYNHGDKSPQDSRASCDSKFSQSTWYREVLPQWAIGVIAASSTLVLVVAVVVIYMKVIRTRTKVNESMAKLG